MSRFTIGKTFRFEAAHSLPSLPDWHKCRRVHGHSYTVQIVLESQQLDKHGFVRDYGELRDFRDLIEGLDHRNLDAEIVRLAGGPMYSTAENLAAVLYEKARSMYTDDRVRVLYVEVRETETSFARCGS